MSMRFLDNLIEVSRNEIALGTSGEEILKEIPYDITRSVH